MCICILRDPRKCPREIEWPLLVSFLSLSPARGHDPPPFRLHKPHSHGFCGHVTVPPEHPTAVLLNSYLQVRRTLEQIFPLPSPSQIKEEGETWGHLSKGNASVSAMRPLGCWAFPGETGHHSTRSWDTAQTTRSAADWHILTGDKDVFSH